MKINAAAILSLSVLSTSAPGLVWSFSLSKVQPRKHRSGATKAFAFTDDLLVDQLKKEKDEVTKKVQVVSKEYQSKIDSLIEENEKVFDDLQTKFDMTALTIGSMEKDIVTKDEKLEEKSTQIDALISQMKINTKTFNDESEAKQSKIKELENISNTNESKIATLEQEISNKDDTIKELEIVSKTKDSTIEGQQSKIEELENTYKTSESTIVSLEQKISDKDDAIQELETVSKTNESKIVTLEKEISDKDDVIKTKDSTIGSLRSEIESTKTKTKELEDATKEMAETEAALENQLELAQNDAIKEKKFNKEQADTYETIVSSLRSELEQTLDELSGLKAGIEAENKKKMAEIAKSKRVAERNQRDLFIERVKREYRINEINRKQHEIRSMLNEVRIQPKPIDVEQQLSTKYKSIDDIGQRAHAILVDLKMIESYDVWFELNKQNQSS